MNIDFTLFINSVDSYYSTCIILNKIVLKAIKNTMFIICYERQCFVNIKRINGVGRQHFKQFLSKKKRGGIYKRDIQTNKSKTY